MEANNIVINTGRSTGMKALKIRLSNLNKKVKEKKHSINWDNMGSHYCIYMENEAKERVFEETVLTRGVKTVKMVNYFCDIFENELEKL